MSIKTPKHWYRHKTPKHCSECLGEGFIEILEVVRASGDYTYAELEHVDDKTCDWCEGSGEEPVIH